MTNVLIIGATSALAIATARRLAQRTASFHLLGRNEQYLATVATDLGVRGAKSAQYAHFDAINFDTHKQIIEQAFDDLKMIDVVLISHGSLPDQPRCESDFPTALHELSINAIGTLSLLTHIANHMERQGSGTIAVITSVAGDRGRQSNYVYGAAKSMVSAYLQGLRNRLYPRGVCVLDVKPGYIDTPMTAEFDKNFLWAKPDTIARDIIKGIDKKSHTIYTPKVWWLIMAIVKKTPESLFKRLKL